MIKLSFQFRKDLAIEAYLSTHLMSTPKSPLQFAHTICLQICDGRWFGNKGVLLVKEVAGR